MTPVRNASWIERTQRGVLVRLDGGTSVRISALAADVVRVLFLRPEGLQLDRTWTVLALGEDDVPWEGRDRMDELSWPVPAFSVQEGDGCAELRTDALSVGIEFVPFRLVWRLPDGRVFAADRAHHPYMLGSGGAHAHAQVRDPGDFYCGLGDKTGPLNLYGRRLRIAMQDSLGFDARSGDPLTSTGRSCLCAMRRRVRDTACITIIARERSSTSGASGIIITARIAATRRGTAISITM